MIMEHTYWNGNGKYQTEYDRLVELMPSSGKSETLAGELIRCVSKLGHELYNNGMGNNSSGAVNMLRSKGAIDAATHATIYPLTRGAIYNSGYNGDSFQLAVESAIDQTIEWILANDAASTSNSDSMFNYEEEDQHFCEECGEEIDSAFGGHLCIDCEDLEMAWEEELNDDGA
tara:strand:- start:2802 stop:3320 length:519 start_codon:yes stop_codon:yes gene_type:complete